jgi:glycerol-3-phosphate dehydrogenase
MQARVAPRMWLVLLLAIGLTGATGAAEAGSGARGKRVAAGRAAPRRPAARPARAPQPAARSLRPAALGAGSNRGWRAGAVAQLRGGQVFDSLVIGGGATGTSVAMQLAREGTSVALVEREDFASETSSRSTKLSHGGVRYLRGALEAMVPVQRDARGRVRPVKTVVQAVKGVRANWRTAVGQLNLVREGKQQQHVMMASAPHLIAPQGFVVPRYTRRERPTMWAGFKAYDLTAGKKRAVPGSKGRSRAGALEDFPNLAEEGLRGAMTFHDASFDDSRMALTFAMTARAEGAAVANHVEVTRIRKVDGVFAVTMRDTLTGAAVDTIRAMDAGPAAAALQPIIRPSSGTHIVLDGDFAPGDKGLLIPKTEDGRLLFVIPKEVHGRRFTLVGTTDHPSGVRPNPQPTEAEIAEILRGTQRYLKKKPGRGDVLSAWNGIRPLAVDPGESGGGATSKISRDQVIDDRTSPNRMINVAGGKWTSAIKMGANVAERVHQQLGRAAPRHDGTRPVPLVGATAYDQRAIEQALRRAVPGLGRALSARVARTYGDRAERLIPILRKHGSARLVEGYDILEAEVIYAAREESSETVVDVLARRTGLSFYDAAATTAAIPRVAALMAAELRWSPARRKAQERAARAYFAPPLE